MKDLHRLVYTSFRRPECNEEEIKKILNSCKKNNPSRNVTGILMHSEKRFIQYIEGAEADVKELYELIKGDPRHASVNLRDFSPIDERLFPSWEMGYKDVSKSLEFNTNVSQSDKKSFEGLISGDLDFTNSGMRVLQLFFNMA